MKSDALGHTVTDQRQGHESLVAVAGTVTLEEGWTFDDETQVEDFIKLDNRRGFVSYIKSRLVTGPGELVKPKIGSELCPQRLLLQICCHRAVECGVALVEGETGLEVDDLNVPILGRDFPLHHAARSSSAGLTELFLRHGARAGLRCHRAKSENFGLLPLNVAIDAVSCLGYLINWTPRTSIFKLIVILCLPQMKEALETNRLLAWNTKRVKEEICYYAKEGKLIELAILLMVAREKVLGPIPFQIKADFTLKGIMKVHQLITIQLPLLINEEVKLMGKGKSNKFARTCKEKKEALVSALLLFEVFERAGDSIEAYLQRERTNAPKEQVAHDVAQILTEAGFILNRKDTDLSDLEDCYQGVLLKKSEKPRERGSQLQSLCMPLSQPDSLFGTKKSTTGMLNERGRSTSICFAYGSPVSSCDLRPFPSFRISKASFCSGLHKTMDVQVKKETKAVQLSVPNFLSSKQLASFALAIRRGVRHV